MDVHLLAEQGYASHGWDPYFFPQNELREADVVNLGFVLNVIEHEPERRAALLNAWRLARRVLIVAAQIVLVAPGKGALAYGDGLITSRNTFQKYYEQQELKSYVDAVLGTDAIPAGPGVFFVFRDEAQAEAVRAQRFHSRAVIPSVRQAVKSFADYREMLEPLMRFYAERGRLPVSGEIANEPDITAEFRLIARAFAVVQRATGEAEWAKISEQRRQDMLVYIALSRFGKRPRFSALPAELQQDIKAFFGSYSQACALADELLFSLGQPGVLAAACRKSAIGKLVGDALYAHVSALDALDPVLRLYEGCASRTFGRLEEATLVKFRIDKPRVSWLCYPDFDSDPHPALRLSLQADLQGLSVSYRDYSDSPNPPILHRKETFVRPDYPLHQKFARLTAQEERHGLFDDTATIGTRNGWAAKLRERGVALRGHRLVRVKD